MFFLSIAVCIGQLTASSNVGDLLLVFVVDTVNKIMFFFVCLLKKYLMLHPGLFSLVDILVSILFQFKKAWWLTDMTDHKPISLQADTNTTGLHCSE